MDAGQGIAARFTWHPEYAGRLLLDVREELVREIAADQRAYALAMEAAESREDDALVSVLRLEKRWSAYDLELGRDRSRSACGSHPGMGVAARATARALSLLGDAGASAATGCAAGAGVVARLVTKAVWPCGRPGLK